MWISHYGSRQRYLRTQYSLLVWNRKMPTSLEYLLKRTCSTEKLLNRIASFFLSRLRSAPLVLDFSGRSRRLIWQIGGVVCTNAPRHSQLFHMKNFNEIKLLYLFILFYAWTSSSYIIKYGHYYKFAKHRGTFRSIIFCWMVCDAN
jgi:hypothetical protein